MTCLVHSLIIPLLKCIFHAYKVHCTSVASVPHAGMPDGRMPDAEACVDKIVATLQHPKQTTKARPPQDCRYMLQHLCHLSWRPPSAVGYHLHICGCLWPAWQPSFLTSHVTFNRSMGHHAHISQICISLFPLVSRLIVEGWQLAHRQAV